MLEVKPLTNAVDHALTLGNQNTTHAHTFGQTEDSLTWDEVHKTYEDLVHAIINIGATVNQFAQIKELRSYIDKSELNQTNIMIKGLGTDLETFTDILLAIRSQHENMAGPITTEEEISHAGTIMGEYGRFATHLQSATMHVSTRITATFEEALMKVKVQNPELFETISKTYFKDEE